MSNSSHYKYNIKQTSDENKEKYQLVDYKLIRYQILHTNITRTVWQTVRRITNEISGVRGLRVTVLLLTTKNHTLNILLDNYYYILSCSPSTLCDI